MNNVFWFVAILILNFKVIHSKIYLEELNVNDTTRIVGGLRAGFGQFPYQVSLQLRKGNNWKTYHFCGGSLVTQIHVLTAAHCLPDSGIIKKIVVVAGSRNLISRKRQKRKIARMAIHPKYSNRTLRADLAVIKVNRPYVLTNALMPMKLVDRDVPVGSMCIVSGWGLTISENNKSTTIHLQYLPIYKLNENSSRCHMVGRGFVCAGVPEEKGSCLGDSGGPLVCEGMLVGIVSFSFDVGHRGCAGARTLDYFTDVYVYREWIDSCLADIQSDKCRYISGVSLWSASALYVLSAITLVIYCNKNWFSFG